MLTAASLKAWASFINKLLTPMCRWTSWPPTFTTILLHYVSCSLSSAPPSLWRWVNVWFASSHINGRQLYQCHYRSASQQSTSWLQPPSFLRIIRIINSCVFAAFYHFTDVFVHLVVTVAVLNQWLCFYFPEGLKGGASGCGTTETTSSSLQRPLSSSPCRCCTPYRWVCERVVSLLSGSCSPAAVC